jgi:hypothetical protein
LIAEDTWREFIHKESGQIIYPNHSYELYFEEENYDDFLARMKDFPDINYVNEMIEFPRDQRVVRFFDPEGHIIEVLILITIWNNKILA